MFDSSAVSFATNEKQLRQVASKAAEEGSHETRQNDGRINIPTNARP